MGRPARGVLRLPQEDQTANTRREREQRCDHAHGQLLHHAAEHPGRAANHLPRLQSWVAVSISRAVCAARHPVPEGLSSGTKRSNRASVGRFTLVEKSLRESRSMKTLRANKLFTP